MIDTYLEQLQETITYSMYDYNEAKDIAAYIFMENLKWNESRSNFPINSKIDRSTLEKVLRSDKNIKDVKIFVAKFKDQVIGGTISSVNTKESIGFIWGLYVEKDFRLGKVTYTLFNNAMNYLKSKVLAIEILIKGGNEAALNFYRSKGFIPYIYVLRYKKSKFSNKNYTSPQIYF